MGYFTLKIAVVALLLIGAAAAFPLGAIAALRRACRTHATESACGLTGAAAAGLLLHREKLARDITLESSHDPLAEGYAPRALSIRLTDTTGRSRSLAALGEAAFAVARATRHADADKDFLRAESRTGADFILTNTLPIAAFLGLVLPEARGLLLLVTPVLALTLALRTALALPAERESAALALRLLRRHDLVAESEIRPVTAYLNTRAARVLARPLTDCFWVSWAL